MRISVLEISHVRNLQPQVVRLHPSLNIIYGDNGSGKTSVLEAIHLVALGRSFRSGKIRRLINDQQESCLVRVELMDGHGAAIRKHSNGDTELRLDGRSNVTIAEMAKMLPVQLLNPESMDLLDGASKARRAMLDWGVFHVEHHFYPAWQRYQRAMKHRNLLLKNGTIQRLSLRPWHVEMSNAGEQLHAFRSEYCQRLQTVLAACLQRFLPDLQLDLSYQAGWSTEQSLYDLLEADVERDVARGHTQAGPHRADLRLRIHGVDADEILSRGQKKLVICALKLAQVELLKQTGHPCTILIDDLAAELDSGARERLCAYLIELGCQVFVTCIESQSVMGAVAGNPCKMFHVEHGWVKESSL